MNTVAECQIYVDRITRSDWWTQRSRQIRIPVKDGRGRRSACASSDGTISLPVWARTPSTILHELAHHLAGLRAHHGVEFKAAYHALAVRFEPELAPRLKADWKGKSGSKIRGHAPKVRYPAFRERCTGCQKEMRQLPWRGPAVKGAYERLRFCTKRCGQAWFDSWMQRVA